MENEKKLYYTCPIQALYMIKEFGVEFVYENGDGIVNLQNLELFAVFDIKSLIDDFKNFGKIYVVKESEYIFEPKQGDMGIESNNLVKIIMRNGKQFFMPEQEIIDNKN